MRNNLLIKVLLGILMCVLSFETILYAEESEYSKNILVETTSNTSLYERPDSASEVVKTLDKNTTLLTLENQQGNWILVGNDEAEGYIEVANITLFRANGIEQEFESKENDFNLIFREIEYRKHEKQQKIVWGITIGALVVSIFAVGIVSTVLNDKKQKGKTKQVKK